ncbi:unannotated protein [freshwater metagenome]|uniref:Unannotated protein n=1 Tax=freshwater metagenome TaxID=449393 RepID=A0A6J5YZS0_9ZZZZ
MLAADPASGSVLPTRRWGIFAVKSPQRGGLRGILTDTLALCR